MMKNLFRTSLLFLFVVLSATAIYPCSCEFWSPNKKLGKAKAVFVGEAIEIGSNGKSADFPVAIKFKVERYWKGVKEEHVIVVTSPLACCTCALRATIGARYLIYAFKTEEGLLETSLCDSRAYEYAEDELKIIGKGKKLKAKSKT